LSGRRFRSLSLIDELPLHNGYPNLYYIKLLFIYFQRSLSLTLRKNRTFLQTEKDCKGNNSFLIYKKNRQKYYKKNINQTTIKISLSHNALALKSGCKDTILIRSIQTFKRNILKKLQYADNQRKIKNILQKTGIKTQENKRFYTLKK
jgi:hypothetical protein